MRASCKVLSVGANFLHLEHFLGRDHDEGLAERSEHLSTEHVEVLRGCRAIHYLDIANFIHVPSTLAGRAVGRVTELKVALDTGAGVLGAVAVEAMRQQHH